MINLAADLFFEAGGVKALALAGAYRELSDQGYAPACVGGCSGGAIIAALVAAGYGGAELEQVVLRTMDWRLFADQRPRLVPPRIGASGGLHTGDYLVGWVRERLAAKGVRTFGDLRDPSAEDPQREYRLQVTVSDLTTRRLIVLPKDAAALGHDPDRLEVADAVRMSMSIPVFYEPVRVSAGREDHVLADGSVLSNFPVWLFDHPPDVAPLIPTFGVKTFARVRPLLTREPDDTSASESSRTDTFLRALGALAGDRSDSLRLDPPNAARTILVAAQGLRSTQFDMSQASCQNLFGSGQAAATQFLSTWDFQEYIQRFRAARL
ncbi:MAG: patatin-like phospholipase family protein [Solirubrobacteraceae bacterium]